MNLISGRLVVAKKHHDCGACYWFDRSNYGERDVSADDWLVVEKAMFGDKGKILPGMQYIKLVGKDGGDLVTVKARHDMHAICLKYDLYPDD